MNSSRKIAKQTNLFKKFSKQRFSQAKQFQIELWQNSSRFWLATSSILKMVFSKGLLFESLNLLCQTGHTEISFRFILPSDRPTVSWAVLLPKSAHSQINFQHGVQQNIFIEAIWQNREFLLHNRPLALCPDDSEATWRTGSRRHSGD